jgi:hypothetical protein
MLPSFVPELITLVSSQIGKWFCYNVLLVHIPYNFIHLLIAAGGLIIMNAADDYDFHNQCEEVGLGIWSNLLDVLCAVFMIKNPSSCLSVYFAVIAVVTKLYNFYYYLFKLKNIFNTPTPLSMYQQKKKNTNKLTKGLLIIIITLNVYIAKLYNDKFAEESFLLGLCSTFSVIVYSINTANKFNQGHMK